MTKGPPTPGKMTDAEIAARDQARGFTDADLAEVIDDPDGPRRRR